MYSNTTIASCFKRSIVVRILDIRRQDNRIVCIQHMKNG